MDAITLLREDHVKVLAMLDELERAPADGQPVTPQDSAAAVDKMRDAVTGRGKDH